MCFELPGQSISVEMMEPGWAVIASDGAGPSGVLALAAHAAQVAVRGSLTLGAAQCRLTETGLTHVREATGPLEAAAMVDRELADDLAHDIRRNGATETRVAVAVVDARGEAVAFGWFDFAVANEPAQCPRPFSSSILARNTAS